MISSVDGRFICATDKLGLKESSKIRLVLFKDATVLVSASKNFWSVLTLFETSTYIERCSFARSSDNVNRVPMMFLKRPGF